MRHAWLSLAVLLSGRAVAEPLHATRVDEPSGLQFALIEGATFHFGCEARDKSCFDDEKPGRTVTVASFWMGLTEVTVDAYERCARSGACGGTATVPGWEASCNAGHSERGRHPINCVDWSQASRFCAWIGGRLPNAEEWELAAKGKEGRLYAWGDEPPGGDRLNRCDRRCPRDARIRTEDDGWAETAPVGTYPKGASRDGLLDLAGNVWEWTSTEHGSGTREVRGGGWSVDDSRWFRNSNRSWWPEKDRMLDLGFRCVLPIP